MPKVLYLSPMIPSFAIKETTDFFVSKLHFSVVLQTDHYVILGKDSHTIHILPAGKDIGQMEFYLEVDDIEAIWDGIREGASAMYVKPPFDRDYGMREMHIGVPQTNTLLFIGQEIHSGEKEN